MNGKTNNDLAVQDILVGTIVRVKAGTLLGDTLEKPLTHEGAQDVIDRLRARDYKIVME